jgi:hypothetical protein
VANDYITADDIRAEMPDTEWGGKYTVLFEAIAGQASRAIDRFVKRRPGAFYSDTDSTEYFDGSGTLEQWVGELAAAPTSVAVAETGDVDSSAGTGGTYTTWATSDYLLWPYNAVAASEPFLRLDIDLLNGSKAVWYRFPKSVKIVGKFGYSAAVPDDVKYATLVQAVRMFKRSQQAFQDAGASVELGALRYVKDLDPDVGLMVQHYLRTTI